MSDSSAPRNSDRTSLRTLGNIATNVNEGISWLKNTARSGVKSIKRKYESLKPLSEKEKAAEKAAEEWNATQALETKIKYIYKTIQKKVGYIGVVDGLDAGEYIDILKYSSEPRIPYKYGESEIDPMLDKLVKSQELRNFFIEQMKVIVDEPTRISVNQILINKMKLKIIRINLSELHTTGKSATFNRKIIFKGIPGRDPTAIFDFQDLTTLYDDENNSTPDKWTYKLKKYNCSLLVCENISLPWEEIAANLDKISIYVKDSPEEESSGPTGGKRKTRRNKKMRSKKSRKNIKKRVNKKY